MHRLGKYKATDSMSELICTNYKILLVMSRFKIALGFGEKNIEDVCLANNVDVNTFLTIVNLLLNEESTEDFYDAQISLTSLISYLQNSHDYFINFRFPTIRLKLLEVLKTSNSDLTNAIMFYFDEYVTEIKKHMMYEETTVFPYICSLLSEKKQNKYNIEVFSKQHNKIESRLTEFKNIIIKYYHAESTNEINSILFDIFNCENDLESHNAIEDRLLIPTIRNYEKNRS